MKERPKGFLEEDKVDHNGEIFDYIRELHAYLWEYVRLFHPSASGRLVDWVDETLTEVKLKRRIL